MAELWTVKSILDWCVGYLERNNDPNPRLSAQWLLSEALGLSRIELYTNFDRPLSIEERTTMRDWVRRRAKGEPLQLISGKAPFRYLTISVAPGVLIPRPETEVLVSEAFAELNLPGVVDHIETTEDSESLQVCEMYPISVLDLCTGSGCIACSIASEYPKAQIVASDISSTACALAQENVDRLNLGNRVKVIQNDLMKNMVSEYGNSFDLIISNPPYIPASVMTTLSSEVTDFEPEIALDGGVDGLDLLRSFLPDALSCLKPKGVLAVELYEDSLEEAAKLASQKGFEHIRIAQDLTGRNRILIARKPSE